MSNVLLEGVSTLLSQLVHQLDAPEADPRAERLLQLCLRIVGARMAGGLHSQAAVVEATRRRLVQAGRASDALTYSELHQRLSRSEHGLHQLPAALQLLTALLDSGATPLGPAGATAALLARAAAPGPPRSLATGATRAPEPNPTSSEGTELAAVTNGDSAIAKSKNERKGRWQVCSSDGDVSEATLVRELLFVMQSIDGAHLKFDEPRDGFVLPSGTKVPTGARQLVGRLAELGWLFRQISSYVKAGAAARESGATAGEPVRAEGGLVAQALRHALQAELDEWFQLIAVLEEQRQSSLTLLQLLVWSSEPMHRLQLMAQLVRGSGHLKGGAMTVALARQERHGDPFVRGYVRQLLRAACAPMFAMLREWLLHGEITDAHDEFFVEQRATPLSRLWESRYVLRHAMLPCFLTEELALEVLNVGKALNFIRLCCGDTQWVLRLGAPLRTTSAASSGTATGDGGRNADGKAGSVDASTLARIEYGQEARLPTVVRSAAALVNGHILELLMRKFELRAHCANLQQFLLLGKGDFVQSLMEHLAPHLARPSAQLHRHHLLSLVESAVRSSSPASFEQQGSAPPSGGAGGGGEGEQYALLLKHLDVSLTKTPGGSGWDAFCLDYNVGSPMDVMLSATAMKSYRQASTFLWRLKRVEYSLTAVWRKHCTTSRLIQNLHRDPAMHGCYLLRNEMVHFVYNLQVYLMFEVIECEWVELCQKLTAATDLEGVLSSHNSFIAAIERKAMLRPEDESIHLALRSLFDAILQFARSQDVLYMSLLEQKAAARQHTAAVGASASEGRWASKGKVSDAQLGTVRVEPRLAEQLNASASEYRTRFATFFALVRGHASYDLSFLAFRLDFNEYYESLALVREEGTSTTPVPAAA